MICPHPKTVIDHSADTPKEICVECEETIRVIEEEEEPTRCEYYEEGMSQPCQRRVKNEEDRCWQHDS